MITSEHCYYIYCPYVLRKKNISETDLCEWKTVGHNVVPGPPGELGAEAGQGEGEAGREKVETVSEGQQNKQSVERGLNVSI